MFRSEACAVNLLDVLLIIVKKCRFEAFLVCLKDIYKNIKQSFKMKGQKHTDTHMHTTFTF